MPGGDAYDLEAKTQSEGPGMIRCESLHAEPDCRISSSHLVLPELCSTEFCGSVLA